MACYSGSKCLFYHWHFVSFFFFYLSYTVYYFPQTLTINFKWISLYGIIYVHKILKISCFMNQRSLSKLIYLLHLLCHLEHLIKKRKEKKRKIEEYIKLSSIWDPWWWRQLVRWVMYVFDIFTDLTKKMLSLSIKEGRYVNISVNVK